MLGYFSASIIHQTLTWTTGSLTCASDPLASLSLSIVLLLDHRCLVLGKALLNFILPNLSFFFFLMALESV